MVNFVDFSLVKENISFERAIELLDLKLKHSGNQYRGPCPACVRAGDRALVITEGRGWYCWGIKKGGDQISLAQHILCLDAKAAAQELAERAGIVPSRDSTSRTVQSRTVPESEGGDGSKLSPLTYLEPENDAVIAIGFDPKKAEAMGIGYAPRGIMRGTVAVPIRDEQGRLLGYIGITEAVLPPDFTANVVPLKRRA